MLERIRGPFQAFAGMEAAGGILLLVCTALALLWANSPWADAYTKLWHLPLSLALGSLSLTMDLHHWINDGLMAIFFFVVGLEIKREILAGELSSPRQAALPMAAAVGGMVVPALLYTLVNAGGPGAAGWGIPMATDIAFALGVLALLGPRVPLALKVFLTALAIVDDLGAVLVIAFFYTEAISPIALAVAAGVTVLLIGANCAGVRRPLVYALLGVPLWLAVLQSGVHATIAGVVLALTIPFRARIDPEAFVREGQDLLASVAEAGTRGPGSARGMVLLNEAQQHVLYELEEHAEGVQTPLHRLEHILHPWVAFGIMPLFALANAGVTLSVDAVASLGQPVALGILWGLMLGKPLGIALFAWLATRFGWAVLPARVSWAQLVGVAWLGGIGFTMSLFIASLAFGDAPLLTTAKMGILLGSLVAGLGGWLVLQRVARTSVEVVEEPVA